MSIETFQIICIVAAVITKALGITLLVIKIIEYRRRHGRFNIIEIIKEWLNDQQNPPTGS